MWIFKNALQELPKLSLLNNNDGSGDPFAALAAAAVAAMQPKSGNSTLTPLAPLAHGVKTSPFEMKPIIIQPHPATTDDNDEAQSSPPPPSQLPPSSPSTPRAAVCRALNCSFTLGETCINALDGTNWRQTSLSSGDLLGGIVGGAEQLPFQRGFCVHARARARERWRSQSPYSHFQFSDSGYAFAIGPLTRARFSTSSFSVDEHLNFVFAYYKSIQIADMRIFIKRKNALEEELIFEVKIHL